MQSGPQPVAVVVRPYRCEDESAVIQAWNDALPQDPVDARVFRRKALLDANFDPDWLLVAEAEGEVAGLCLCIIRRVPLEGTGLEPERGWITAFGVRPGFRRQGVGCAVLERALALFREAGRKTVAIAPYAPNYFVPGVDVAGYPEGLAFLEKRGFEAVSDAISMDANTVLLDAGKWLAREAGLREQGIEVRHLQPHEGPRLLGFLRAHMTGDWARHARDLLVDVTRGLAHESQFTIAVCGEEVVGYCQYEGEHFGPFGVRDDMQGKGIGTVLLARCLQTMREAGHHNAWVLWTSDDSAAKVYSRFGFAVTRRFAVLRREL